MRRFYVFEEASKTGCIHLVPKSDYNYHDILVGKIDLSGIDFDIEAGKKEFDIISSGSPFLTPVSSELKCVIEANGFSGVHFVPARISGVNIALKKTYFQPIIRGRCGEVDDGQSKIEKRENIKTNRIYSVKIGLVFDEKTWDGSDFFIPSGTGYIIVSERVRDVLISKKMSNVLFADTRDYERS